jgi:hypothetical protein
VHPADDDQGVDDLWQAFFPRTAALEARGDGVFSQWHARIGQCLRHQLRVDTGLRRKNGQHANDLGVRPGRFQGQPVVLGAGLFRQIDQIRQTGMGGQLRPQQRRFFV